MLGPAAMLARAGANFATAFPAEVTRVALARRRATTTAARDYGLPRRPAGPIRSITYLRSEPSLRYLGAHVGGAAAHTAGVINGLVNAGVAVHVVAAERPDGINGAAVTEVPPRRIFQLVHWPTLIDYSDQQVRAAAAAAPRPDAIYQRYALGSFAGLELAAAPAGPADPGVQRLGDLGRAPVGLRATSRSPRPSARSSAATCTTRRSSSSSRRCSRTSWWPTASTPTACSSIPTASTSTRSADVRALRAGRVARAARQAGGPDGRLHRHVRPVARRAAPARRSSSACAPRAPDVRWILVGERAVCSTRCATRSTRRGLGEQGRAHRHGPTTRAPSSCSRACDVCVSPHVPNPDGSRFFGSPTKLFEYMGLGSPIVASDLEQIGEVIEHERTGLLCPPGDVQAAADAVAAAARRRRAASAARARRRSSEARTHYSWDAHARRILDAAGALGARIAQ